MHPAAILVRLVASDTLGIELSVADDGVGLPPGFDPSASRELGMRIARALAKQVGAELRVRARDPRHRVRPGHACRNFRPRRVTLRPQENR